MVKKLTLIFLLISLTSCNKHYYFTKDNNNIVYKNFNDSILDLSECNFQSFRKINLKIFSLENIDNKNYIKMFDKITFRKLFISQENAFNDFNKRRYNK